MFKRIIRYSLVFVAATAAGLAGAQDRSVPYWASLNAEKVFMRVGPSASYPIEWVYAREGLPVKVIRLNEGWRYVEDPQGARGWMAARLLSRDRSAIVIGDEPAEMHADAAADSPLRWNLEPGVVGVLGSCESGWCELDVNGHKGWVDESSLWGDGDP